MRSVIIPAAGLASRMKPLSKGISKAMIPVNGRPLISYIIEHLEKSQDRPTEYVIVQNELNDIEEFITRVYPYLNVKYVNQYERKGPLHAIQLGAKQSNRNACITIWLGDTICLDDFDFNVDFLAVHQVNDPHRWCLVDKQNNLYDKPTGQVPTDLALIGVYNFVNRNSFDLALGIGMAQPLHNNEHQIASLISTYVDLNNQPMDLIETVDWYDCGELNSYYESKARLLKKTARSFNNIDVNTLNGTITKSSFDESKANKIENEKNWFLQLNEEQSLFCPRILTTSYGVLKMTLEPGVALNEVLVYDNLRADVWHDIIRKILYVHHEVFYIKDNDTRKNSICFDHYFEKNKNRLDGIYNQLNVRQRDQNIINDFFETTALSLCRNPKWSKVIHGDSHLGNIIYDPHTGNTKFVDPRGSFGDITGTAGDLRYDMGKLLQDFYCGYSMILAERYRVINRIVHIDWVGDTQHLSTIIENGLHALGYDVHLLKKLSVLLLLTAIPFHNDNPHRQKVFLLRCLDLINILN